MPKAKIYSSENVKNPENLKIIMNYLNQLEFYGKSSETITSYRTALYSFFSHINKPLSEIGYDDVLNWRDSYRPGKSKQTLCSRYTALSSFFKYCVFNGYITKVPIKKRWRPKLKQPTPKALDNITQSKIRLQCENLNIRNRAIIEFLFSSGVRVSELVNLRVKDIDLEKRTANVIGKGDKERIVHFSETCLFLLKLYLSNNISEDAPLFRNLKNGSKLGRKAIANITRKIGRSVGLPKGFSPHICRHTFATNLISYGATLEFVSAELGHEQLSTTKIYVRRGVKDPKIKEIYHRCMR